MGTTVVILPTFSGKDIGLDPQKRCRACISKPKRVPQIRGTFFGVPMMTTIVFRGLYGNIGASLYGATTIWLSLEATFKMILMLPTTVDGIAECLSPRYETCSLF